MIYTLVSYRWSNVLKIVGPLHIMFMPLVSVPSSSNMCPRLESLHRLFTLAHLFPNPTMLPSPLLLVAATLLLVDTLMGALMDVWIAALTVALMVALEHAWRAFATSAMRVVTWMRCNGPG
jgi:hypothetical protein